MGISSLSFGDGHTKSPLQQRGMGVLCGVTSCLSLGKAAQNTVSCYAPVLTLYRTISGHRMAVAATRETLAKTLRIKGRQGRRG